MASFNTYAPRLRRWEGNKFVCDPADYGGATKGGVTLKTFRMVFGADKTVDDLKNMTEDQWRRVMKGEFWDKCRADQIDNQDVAEIIVDWCINSGIGKIKLLQQHLGVAVDGKVGPVTLAAINGANQEALHGWVKLTRAQRFINQIAADGTQMKFFGVWFNRLIDFKFTDPLLALM